MYALINCGTESLSMFATLFSLIKVNFYLSVYSTKVLSSLISALILLFSFLTKKTNEFFPLQIIVGP